MHFERDGASCTPAWPGSGPIHGLDMYECHQGACGTWVDVETIVNSEAERLEWVASDPWVDSQSCHDCWPQGTPREQRTAAQQANYPMYLNLNPQEQMTATAENPDGYGHGSGSVANAVHSFMRWKHPELHYQGWRVDEADRVPGDMRGRALIVSKSGACAQVGQFGSLQCTQWQCQNGQGCADDPDNNHLQIRSENQIPLSGYSKMQVFVPSASVQISNVRTHSTRQYEAAPVNVGQPYCTPAHPSSACLSFTSHTPRPVAGRHRPPVLDHGPARLHARPLGDQDVGR